MQPRRVAEFDNSVNGFWESPPKIPVLRQTEVHVWRASLDLDEESLHRFFSTLSADERLRAKRFRFQLNRWRFVAARGILRALLAAYGGVEAHLLKFNYGPHGKPVLEPRVDGTLAAVEFNLSYSRGQALYAFSLRRALGVDVEFQRPDIQVREIAERFFSPLEYAELVDLADTEQQAAFYRCWSRKEAYLKARGEGIGYGLDKFAVPLGIKQAPALLHNTLEPDEVSRWWFVSPDVGVEYTAALVVEGHDWSMACWQWGVSLLP